MSSRSCNLDGSRNRIMLKKLCCLASAELRKTVLSLSRVQARLLNRGRLLSPRKTAESEEDC